MPQPTYLDDGVHPRFSNLTEARPKGTMGVSAGVLYVSLDSAAASYGEVSVAGGFTPAVYVNDSSSTPQTLGLRALAAVNDTTLIAPATGVYRVESTIEFETAPTNILSQTLLDLNAMVTQIQALTPTGTLAPGIVDGQVIVPGVFDVTGATTVAGTTTFNAGGNADAIFVIRVTGSTTFGAGNTHVLAGGAQACNIYWLLNGAAASGASIDIKGSLICIAGGMSPGGGLVLEGRLLTTNGSLGLTGSTQTLPSGTPSTDLAIDLLLLSGFAYYTGVGTIGDATQVSGVGNVGSGNGGTITLASQTGTIYTTTDTAMDVHFDVQIAGVTAPDCARHFEGTLATHGSSVILMCVAALVEGDTVLTRFDSTLGGVVIGNRGAFALRLA